MYCTKAKRVHEMRLDLFNELVTITYIQQTNSHESRRSNAPFGPIPRSREKNHSKAKSCIINDKQEIGFNNRWGLEKKTVERKSLFSAFLSMNSSKETQSLVNQETTLKQLFN